MRGRPKTELVLSHAEREQLTALTLRCKTAQAQALRARIVLGCADGMDNKAVASGPAGHAPDRLQVAGALR